MNSPRTRLYRDKANAKLFGVCSGIADYTGISTFWVRLAMFVSLFTPINWLTFLGYFASAFFLEKKPPYLYGDKQQDQYWQRVRQSPKRTAREIRAQMKDIDRRLADVESFYVNSNPRLTAEIEKLR